MKNDNILQNDYVLCGFLNIYQLFPAFVYPVFCKEDDKGDLHYYFEDGKLSTIQQFYEIDLHTFPELIMCLPVQVSNFSTGSNTIYAYAVGPENVVWGNIKEFIPALKQTLPTISNSAHRQKIKRFISQHWKEKLTWQQKKKTTKKSSVVFALATTGMAVVALLLVTLMWYGKNVSRNNNIASIVPDNPREGNSDNYSNGSENNPEHSVALLSEYEYINPTPDSPIINNLVYTFTTSDPYSSNDQVQQLLDVVIVDSKTGKQYDAQDLVDKSLLIPYREGEQECFFFGSLNKNGNYDGRCIVNVYKSKKLLMIADSFYENGKLLYCKQMFSYTTKRKEQVWAFSFREPGAGNFRTGETWTYFYKEITQDFTYEDVSLDNIMSANDFDRLIEMIGAQKEGYYNGNTKNGFFEDTTGNAYMVKYFKENGEVRNLYVGQVKHGDHDDDTGNAWEIGKLVVNQERYAHFKGLFFQGEEGDGSWNYKPTQDDINNYLKGYTFKCPLPGLVESETEATNS